MAIGERGIGLGNKYVRILGTTAAVIGLLMIIGGQGLSHYIEIEPFGYWAKITKPYEDLGNGMYSFGWVLLIAGIIVLIVGLILKPSMREILKAELMVWEGRHQLAAIHGGYDLDHSESESSLVQRGRIGTGNKLVRSLGTTMFVIGLLMIVGGQGLSHYIELEWSPFSWGTKPYQDLGDTMYEVGCVLFISGIVVYIAGLILKPFMREILKAELFVWKNRHRLATYRGEEFRDDAEGEDSGPDHSDSECSHAERSP